MENRIIELFEENFGFAFKATTYNNMIVAIRTFEQFKKKNEDFFSFEKRETVFGHLRTYAIERQFNASAFNPKANYSVSMKQVNSYKHKALCIETKDFIVNLGRTNGAFKLLSKSSYKKEFAKSNAGLSMQLSFDLSGEYPVVIESKKYAQITYGYKFGDMTHLSIVLPSDNYSGSEYTVNLLADVNVYKNYVPEELVEESIVALKKNLSDEIEKKYRMLVDMMENEKKVVPYRIKQARISRGLSMVELSDLVSVSKQAISQYEMGKNAPSKATLNAIASVLKYPTSFFYKPMPANENASSAVFFRCKKTTKVKALNAAREKIEIFREINDYLEKYIDFPTLDLPKIIYEDDGINPLDNEQIEQYAMTLRKYWGLGNRPVDNLISIVQKKGIMVSKMQLRLNKLDAFSVWFDNKPFIFLSSDKDTNVRIRFDIAHELGHLLMHSDYYSEEDLKNSAIHEKLENEADRFAGAFLLPKETYSKDVFSTSIDHFIQLKAKWKASIGCMIYRCDTLGILSPNQIKYLKDQMTTRVYWRKEPLDKEMPIEKPFAHKQAILLLLDNNIVTANQLVEETGCSAEELEQYCFLDKGTLETKDDSKIIALKIR